MNMFKPNTANSPEEYIAKIEDETRRADIQSLHNLIRKSVPDLKPFMISGMIGYGTYHYTGKSGREGDWCVLGLASQKNYISVYACAVDGSGQHYEYVAEKYKKDLPKANIGKSCIRFKKLSDVDTKILQEIFRKSEKLMKATKFSLSFQV